MKRMVLIASLTLFLIAGVVEVARDCCSPRLPPGSQTPAPIPTLYVFDPVFPSTSVPLPTSVPTPVEIPKSR